MLTTTEAANRCGVSSRTLLRWLTAGQMPGQQTAGGHWRVAESALIGLLPPGQSRDASTLQVKGQRLCFAVIDDEQTHASALARVLALLAPEARIDTASDGVSAGLLLGLTRADVAFVDIEMPRMDGLELIRRVRATPELKETLFVVVSGRISPSRRKALSALGICDILAKPVRVDQLRRVVAKLTAGSNGPGAGAANDCRASSSPGGRTGDT